MALNLLNLDQAIRQLMLKEIDVDINSGKLYISTRLSLAGAKDYPVPLFVFRVSVVLNFPGLFS